MGKIVTLSEAAAIALHGVMMIAESDKPVNVVEISETTDSSKHHVAKIMQRLTKQGFVTSKRGPSGGFVLLKDPDQISYLDVYEAIEGKLEICKCPVSRSTCSFSACLLGGITQKMTKDFIDYLSKKTIGQEAQKQQKLKEKKARRQML